MRQELPAFCGACLDLGRGVRGISVVISWTEYNLPKDESDIVGVLELILLGRYPLSNEGVIVITRHTCQIWYLRLQHHLYTKSIPWEFSVLIQQ